jgi:hypothetical protein
VITKKTELCIERKFDPVRCRHSVNGETYVLHCHHYATLYTRLAEDCAMLDGKKLLREMAEDAIYKILMDYYSAHAIASVAERIAIGEQYYSFTGLGQMRVVSAGSDSAEVDLLHSHVDSGWIKKWGQRDKPVNYISCGFVAGMLAAALGKGLRSFSVTEAACIVSGAENSRLTAVAL